LSFRNCNVFVTFSLGQKRILHGANALQGLSEPGLSEGRNMKFAKLCATLTAATFVVATPAFAKHASHKSHASKSEMHKKGSKAAKGSDATEDLNARSLQQAQTPVPASSPAAAPAANATAPVPAPMPMDPSMKMPASSMPAPAGQ